MFRDSLDKVIGTYLALVCAKSFTYKAVEYEPTDLIVSPLLFRGFTCPSGCGGCCPRFSLDYLPSERHPPEAKPRTVTVNGRDFCVYSDLQDDHEDWHCRNLRRDDGRCGIYDRRPFSCDFELIRFIESKSRNRPTYMTQKLFGRGWQLLRIDGERGALCTMTPPTVATMHEVLRKVDRLQQWADYFVIPTRLRAIRKYVATGPHIEPLVLRV